MTSALRPPASSVRRTSRPLLRRLYALLPLALLSVACDPAVPRFVEEPSPSPAPLPPDATRFNWEEWLVDAGNGGAETHMTLDLEGRPVMAYFAPQFGTFEPDPPDLPGTPTPAPAQGFGTPQLYELRVARFNGSGWDVETVVNTNQARGLSIAQSKTGPLMVAYLESNPNSESVWCSAGRLMVATDGPDGWTSTPVAEPEGQLDPTCDLQGCTPCEVAGEFPSIAEGASGQVGITYRRARYTLETLSNPDSDQEFQEFNFSNGVFTKVQRRVIQSGTGAGFYGSLTYAADGGGTFRPHIAYLSLGQDVEEGASTLSGLWYAYYDGAGWQARELQREHDWLSGPQIQVSVYEGEVNILLYAWMGDNSTAKLDLILMRSTDQGLSWTPEYITHDGRAGGFPSLDRKPDGTPVVSYYQCTSVVDYICSAEGDGLILAERPGFEWESSVVHADPLTYDGMYSAMVWTRSGPVIAARSGTARTPDEVRTLYTYFGEALEDN
ncbi:MAG: hypothetical protein ACKO6N_12900 [Myxococcota bacterium]